VRRIDDIRIHPTVICWETALANDAMRFGLTIFGPAATENALP
jgi:hypothetical protein